ncbi:MAG: glycosyltransferase [Planctomycetota bacterium]
MAFPRVLLVTASAGNGHARASAAIAAALRARHPTIDLAEVDVITRLPRWHGHTYKAGYVRLVDRHPLVWRAMYEDTDRKTTALGHLLSVWAGRRFLRESIAWRPDLVVSTQFLPPELFAWAHRKGWTKVPLHTVITDHDAHRIWWQPEVEQYYVASDLVRARLAYRFAVPFDRIHVTGIPIDAGFRARRDPVAIRARLGLDPARPTVLFLSGGFAPGPMAASILGIWQDRPDVQVVAVCGRNVRLARRIADLPRPEGGTLHVLGFRDDVPDLMTVADLVVGKSGGLTMSECLAVGRPFVVSHAIAGQEERNADALLAGGGGVKAPTPEEVRWHVVRLLARPDDLRAMAARARAMGRPDAADLVADRIAERVHPTVAVPLPPHGAPRLAPRA